MGSLVTQVVAHFAHEERLMRESGYPKLPQHSQAHATFVRDALDFKREYEAKGLTPEFRRWATGRLLTWFRFHILAHDVELGLYLLKHGKVQGEAETPHDELPTAQR